MIFADRSVSEVKAGPPFGKASSYPFVPRCRDQLLDFARGQIIDRTKSGIVGTRIGKDTGAMCQSTSQATW